MNTSQPGRTAGPPPQPARDMDGEIVTSDAFAASDPRAYIQLAAAVAEEITAGKYAPGDQLPSIRILCAESGLSRQTAGKALRLLERQGRIDRYPGLGYFVRGQATPGQPAAPGPAS